MPSSCPQVYCEPLNEEPETLEENLLEDNERLYHAGVTKVQMDIAEKRREYHLRLLEWAKNSDYLSSQIDYYMQKGEIEYVQYKEGMLRMLEHQRMTRGLAIISFCKNYGH